MKRFFGLSIVLALLLAIAAPVAAGHQGPPGPPDGDNTNAKTAICHYSDKSDTYFKVWMSEKGAEKHLAAEHGDGPPGDPVPDMAGYEFGNDCSLLTGSITVIKSTDPAGGTGFEFTGNIGMANIFSLDDGGSKTFTNVVSGTYTVTEDDPQASPGGFDLTGLACVDSDAAGTPSTTDVGTRVATIELDPGETVTCVFTNVLLPTVEVIKSLPSLTGVFDLQINGTTYVADVGDGGTTGPIPVAVGPVTVSELAGTDTDLSLYESSVSCDNGDSADPATSLTLSALSAGETVTCTFTNEREALAPGSATHTSASRAT